MPTLTFATMAGLLLLASLLDLLWHRLPNPLTVGAALLAIILSLWQGGLDAVVQSLLGLLLGFVLLLPGFISGFTGGGDVKLMAATGSFLGPTLVLYAFVLYLLAALAFALVYALYAWLFRGADLPLGRYWAMLLTLLRTGRVAYVRPKPGEAMGHRLPMAPAIAFGAILAPFL